jgi:phenylacetate-CoA ligase
VLPDGEDGELVFTSLTKQAMPVIRYRTRDISRIVPGDCRCGSRHPRLARLTGRSDDMVKVRGVQVYPAQIDTVLARVPECGSEYQVRITREGGRERLLVRVEAADDRWPATLEHEVAEALRAAIGVRPEVEVVAPATLPRSERKTRRVFDERDA